MTKQSWWPYSLTTVKWLLGNLGFGLAPLLFLLLVQSISSHKIGEEEIELLIRDGVVLFVLCAIMGSILVDYWLGGYMLTGSQIFFIFGSPFLLLAILCLTYLLVKLKIVDNNRFDLTSLTSIVFIVSSLIYCFISKTNLYIREATSNEDRLRSK